MEQTKKTDNEQLDAIYKKWMPNATQEQIEQIKKDTEQMNQIMDDFNNYVYDACIYDDIDNLDNPIYEKVAPILISGLKDDNEFKESITDFLKRDVSNFSLLCFYLKKELDKKDLTKLFLGYLGKTKNFYGFANECFEWIKDEIENTQWMGHDDIDENGQIHTREYTFQEKVEISILGPLEVNLILTYIDFMNAYNEMVKNENNKKPLKKQDITQANTQTVNVLLSMINAFGKPNAESKIQAVNSVIREYNLYPTMVLGTPNILNGGYFEFVMMQTKDGRIVSTFINATMINPKNVINIKKTFQLFLDTLSKEHKLTKANIQNQNKITVNLSIKDMVDKQIYSSIYDAKRDIKKFILFFLDLKHKFSINLNEYNKKMLSGGINLFSSVNLTDSELIFSLNTIDITPSEWLNYYGSQFKLDNSLRYAITDNTSYSLHDYITSRARILYEQVMNTGFINIPMKDVKLHINLTYARDRNTKSEILKAVNILNTMFVDDYQIFINSSRHNESSYIETKAENFFEYGFLTVVFANKYIVKSTDIATQSVMRKNGKIDQKKLSEKFDKSIREQNKNEFKEAMVNEQIKELF